MELVCLRNCQVSESECEKVSNTVSEKASRTVKVSESVRSSKSIYSKE